MRKIFINILVFFILLAPIAASLSHGLHLDISVAHAADDAPSFWSDAGAWLWHYIKLGITKLLWLAVGLITWLISVIDAYLFSVAIDQTLVHLGQFYNDNFNEAVNTAWKISRDLSNLLIISMFVYAAIGTILRLSDYNLEKFIVKIIIVALLVNFSMFFAKFAIDVSNVVAYQIYREMKKATNSKEGESIKISSVILQKIGTNNLEAQHELAELAAKKNKFWRVNGVIFPLTIFVLAFLAGVLVYGTIVMFTRVLGIILVIALSAVGFVMMIVPNIGDNFFEKWWNALLRYAIFAPLFMFMLFISLTVIDALGGQQSMLVAMASEKDLLTALLYPFVIIGLLLASIKISNSLSIVGSNIATKLALETGSAMSWFARAPLSRVPKYTLGTLKALGMENTGAALWASRLYSGLRAPASNSGKLAKTLGLKSGLSWAEKGEIKGALKDINARRAGKLGGSGDLADQAIGSTLRGIGKGIAKIHSKSGSPEEKTETKTEHNENNTRVVNVHEHDEDAKSQAAQQEEAIKRGEETRRRRQAEEAADKAAWEAKEAAQEAAHDMDNSLSDFESLNEVHDFIDKIQNDSSAPRAARDFARLASEKLKGGNVVLGSQGTLKEINGLKDHYKDSLFKYAAKTYSQSDDVFRDSSDLHRFSNEILNSGEPGPNAKAADIAEHGIKKAYAKRIKDIAESIDKLGGDERGPANHKTKRELLEKAKMVYGQMQDDIARTRKNYGLEQNKAQELAGSYTNEVISRFMSDKNSSPTVRNMAINALRSNDPKEQIAQFKKLKEHIRSGDRGTKQSFEKALKELEEGIEPQANPPESVIKRAKNAGIKALQKTIETKRKFDNKLFGDIKSGGGSKSKDVANEMIDSLDKLIKENNLDSKAKGKLKDTVGKAKYNLD